MQDQSRQSGYPGDQSPYPGQSPYSGIPADQGFSGLTPDHRTSSEPPPPTPRHRILGFLGELPVLVISALLLAVLIKTFLIQAFFIPSLSMAPTLEINDRVLVNKVSYHLHDPGRGDIVVFVREIYPNAPKRSLFSRAWNAVAEGFGQPTPGEADLIKRVIGLPGDTVEGKGGHVLINGSALAEPWLFKGVSTSDFSPVTLGEDEYFVMGDNRGNSSDSRVIGPIKRGVLVGRAVVRIWPPGRAGSIKAR